MLLAQGRILVEKIYISYAKESVDFTLKLLYIKLLVLYRYQLKWWTREAQGTYLDLLTMWTNSDETIFFSLILIYAYDEKYIGYRVCERYLLYSATTRPGRPIEKS